MQRESVDERSILSDYTVNITPCHACAGTQRRRQYIAWALDAVWTGTENLVPHRDSIPGPSNP